MAKLDNAAKKEIIGDLAIGRPQTEIAKDHGVTHRSISYFKNKASTLAFLQKHQEKLLGVIPKAVKNLISLVENFNNLEGKEKELAYKASLKVLETGSICPTMIQTQYVQNIYQSNKITVIDPVVMKAIGSHVAGMFSNSDSNSDQNTDKRLDIPSPVNPMTTDTIEDAEAVNKK